MWEARDAILNCILPAKIVFDSLRILLTTNKLVFSLIFCFTILPVSFLTLNFIVSTHTLRSQIFHNEAVAQLASTIVESRQVLLESREDAASLVRTKALLSILCFPLSLIAAVSAVHAASSAVHGRPVTARSAAAAVRQSWKRAAVTAIVAYAALLAYAPVPRVLAAVTASPGSRLLILAIASAAEVYLMAVLGLGLVVSIAEERFGFDAIRVGSGLLQGRRFCGWVLSGLFVWASDSINRRVEALSDGQDLAGWVPVIGDLDLTVVVCSYGLLVLVSYVVTAVFYCDGRRRCVIKEADQQDDHQDGDISL